MMTAGFAQDGGKITPTEAESLLDGSRHRDFGVAARHSELLAINPHPSGAVIDFKRGHTHHVERIHHPACDRNLVVVKSRRITIDRLDAAARRASSQQKGSGNTAGYGDRLGNSGHGASGLKY